MPFSVDYQEQVEEAVCLMDQRAAVSFASDCIERALFAWEVIRPRDVRPRVAARATVQWLRGAADTETIAQAGEAASNAAAEADYPELVEDTNPELARAIHAANAASHAALAAECAARGDDEDLPNAVACAADLAARAANDPQAERAWQIARLTQLLLTHDRSGYFKP